MKNTENLIKRLKAQIKEAREIESDWAYVTIGDAKKILKLLEEDNGKEAERGKD